MRTLTFADALAAVSYSGSVDILMGYPSKGRDVGGGIHVVPPLSPPGPGWTTTNRPPVGVTYGIDARVDAALETRDVAPATRAAVMAPIKAQLGNKMPTAHVLDYGAVGDGLADDTDAIKATYLAAGTSGEVVFPAGVFLVRAGEIDLGSRRIRGALSHPATNTTLRAVTSGPWVVRIQGMSCVRDLMLDANNLATSGLLVDVGHGSQLERIQAQKALDYAIDIQRTTAHFRGLRGFNSKRGIRVQGCNGSTLYDCEADFNEGRGWLITKAAVEGGECALFRCWADINNRTNLDPEAILIDGVDGGAWYGGYVEGSGSGFDGNFVLTNKTHNWLLAGLHFIGPVLSLVGDCRAITVVGCRAPDTTGVSPHMLVTASGGVIPRDIAVIGCYQTSAGNSEPWTVRWTDGVTVWDSVALDGWQADGAPTIGWWRAGATIQKRVPISGQPMGWRQQAQPGGQPGTWLPMPNMP
jgi:Pectate lyase superfamily protein